MLHDTGTVESIMRNDILELTGAFSLRPPPPSPGTEASRLIERVESPSRSEPPVSPPAPPLPSPPFPRGTPRSPFLFTPPHALRGGTAGAHETQSHDA